MFLNDFYLASRANCTTEYTGIDSYDHCIYKQHFENYPYEISYKYNNRGFRDLDWPETFDALQQAIWCVGDSFTVGLGSPESHAWPYILQSRTQKRTINVSMDGASNSWIARKSIRILEQVAPNLMVIQWSYVSRRELDINALLDRRWNMTYAGARQAGWPDCTRQQIWLLESPFADQIQKIYQHWIQNQFLDEEIRVPYSNCTDQEDINNTLDCIKQVIKANDHTRIIHSFVPDFVPTKFKGYIESQIPGLVIPEITKLDLARDGHHYDRLTSNWVVDQIMKLID